jgi:hypothetical protein
LYASISCAQVSLEKRCNQGEYSKVKSHQIMEHDLNIFESKHFRNKNPFNEKRLRSYDKV